MGKYKMDQGTLDKIRAGRDRIPNIPEDSSPRRPDDYRELIAKAEKKQGPWKWFENATIAKTETIETELNSGVAADRVQINFDFGPGSETNPDYVHAEFFYMNEQEDGSMNQMTEMSLGNIDAIIQAVGAEYELDDEGDPDPLLTLEGLVGSELRVKMSAGVSFRKKTKEFQSDVKASEFLPVE